MITLHKSRLPSGYLKSNMELGEHLFRVLIPLAGASNLLFSDCQLYKTTI